MRAAVYGRFGTGCDRGNVVLRLTTAGPEPVPSPAEEQPRKAAS